jgi:hypothetical protein
MAKSDHELTRRTFAASALGALAALGLGCESGKDRTGSSRAPTPDRPARQPGITPPTPPKPRRRKRGILGRPAPQWKVNRWFNLPAGQQRLDVTDFRGQVVYLFFFQSW